MTQKTKQNPGVPCKRAAGFAQAQRGRGWAELVGMSGGGTETPVGCEAAPGGGSKKRDSLGTAGSAHLIIKGTECQGYSSWWIPAQPHLPGGAL